MSRRVKHAFSGESRIWFEEMFKTRLMEQVWFYAVSQFEQFTASFSKFIMSYSDWERDFEPAPPPLAHDVNKSITLPSLLTVQEEGSYIGVKFTSGLLNVLRTNRGTTARHTANDVLPQNEEVLRPASEQWL
jgi:hypothetical protein